MIYIDKIAPEDNFEMLLQKVVNGLKKKASDNPSYFSSLTAELFEQEVCDMMNDAKNSLNFKVGTISRTGVKKFPDIETSYRYGVEVKSVKSSGWRSTGNSVQEESRVDNIDHVYIMFGRLTDKPDFKYRAYENCLYDISVTHSPRYMIDMNLKDGASIFGKIGKDYDSLRQSEDSLNIIMSYLRKKYAGKQLWYINNDRTYKPYVEFWSDVTEDRKQDIMAEAFVRFPEILHKKCQSKYKAFAAWLVSTHGVMSSSLRDIFSARGKVTITIDDRTFSNIPRVFLNLQNTIQKSILCLNKIPARELAYTYGIKGITNKNKLKIWTAKIISESESQLGEDEILVVYYILANSIGPVNTPSAISDFIREHRQTTCV